MITLNEADHLDGCLPSAIPRQKPLKRNAEAFGLVQSKEAGARFESSSHPLQRAVCVCGGQESKVNFLCLRFFASQRFQPDHWPRGSWNGGGSSGSFETEAGAICRSQACEDDLAGFWCAGLAVLKKKN